MKRLVLYYSHSGNTRFLARKIADALGAESEEIIPRVKSVSLLVLDGAIGLGAGLKPFQHKLEDYDQIILCGPIWMGQLIAPLRDALQICCGQRVGIAVAVSCGSGDEQKDEKYGYGGVLNCVRQIGKDQVIHCAAFPVKLGLPPEDQRNDEELMHVHWEESNFSQALQDRLDQFVESLMGVPAL